jgi:hypothetical protein
MVSKILSSPTRACGSTWMDKGFQFKSPRLHYRSHSMVRLSWCLAMVIVLSLSGCAGLDGANLPLSIPANPGVNTTKTPFVMPTIADPEVKGLYDYFAGLLGREDLLSRRTIDDGVVALEAILAKAGWGKAINHNDYEKVIDGVQKHLDDPSAPFLEQGTPQANPYPEGTWEHDSFDMKITSSCARDYPELAKSYPDLCK